MRMGTKKKDFLSVVSLFLTVIVLVLACLFLFGCNDENDSGDRNPLEELPEITGITVLKSVYDYDGLNHSIELGGLLPKDKIYYSIDSNNWQASNFRYYDAGEYIIYFKIIRDGYAEYSGLATLVIVPTSVISVSVEDITCVYGSPIEPKVDGIESGDVIEYSVDGRHYTESIGALDAGEYVITYNVRRRGAMSVYGTFNLTVLPDIRGTYIGNGKRVILSHTTAVINGNENVMSYGVDGSGAIDVDGETINFSVKDGVLEMEQEKYVKLKETEQLLELRINGAIYYAARLDKSKARISLTQNSAAVRVDGTRIVGFEEYNYCEGIIGGSNVRHDYMWKCVEFEVDSDFVDITLSYRLSEMIDNIEQKVVYDGNSHAIDCEFENVVYWYRYESDNHYETTPREYTEVGKYRYLMFVLRDGYLPQPVAGSLIILPNLSGAYVADGSVLQIDGLAAELNGKVVAFELELTEMKIDGKAAVFDDGKIVFEGVEYVRSEAKLMAISTGGTVGVIERSDGEYALNVTENGGMTQISLVETASNEVCYSLEISGKVASVFYNGKGPLKEWDGVYYISESNAAGNDVAWLIIELEE